MIPTDFFENMYGSYREWLETHEPASTESDNGTLDCDDEGTDTE